MAKKAALRKLIIKEIWTSKARFFSILILIFLGVGFFSGLQATGPNMKNTADQYFEQYNLHDFHVQSTMGLEEEELELIAGHSGVEQIEAGYSRDVLAGESRLVMKLIGYRDDLEINQYVVNNGRLPEHSGEIALDNHESIRALYSIGDEITIYPENSDTDLTEDFNQTTFEVVGFVTSPRFITEESRGQTSIGRGNLDAFAVILEDDFDLPVYTDLFAKFTKLSGESMYSEDYQNLAAQYKSEIESELDEYGPERIAEIREEAEEELAEAEAEIADGRTELAEAKKELNDARQELDEGWTELEDGENELAQARQDLEQGEQEYKDGLATFEREIADGERQLAEGRTELENQQPVVEESRRELEQGEAELASARREIEAQLELLTTQQAEVNRLRTELTELFEVPVDVIPEETQAEIVQETATISLGEQTLANLLQAYFAGELPADPIQAGLSQLEAELSGGITQLNEGLNEVEEGEAEVAAGRAELEAGQADLDAARQLIAEQQGRLERERASAEAELAAARRELDQGWRDYESGRVELEDARQTLTDGEIEYEAGLATFEAEQADAIAEIEEGEAEIAEARAELADLEEPTYYSATRHDIGAMVEYADNAGRLSDLASIFPVVFFAIAALVTLTTITRMIEEQRGEIGTFKALGYSNLAVSLKFYVYAISASAVGTIVGLLFGYLILPQIIFNAYRMLYNLPDIELSNYWLYTLISAGISLFSTVLTAWYVLRVDLKSHPAVLMRPRAPKSGKRILLERITPIWNRLNFIEKVTARNLFRYKQRMLMTVLGIAGCAALIVTGFGLKDAVGGMGDLQFGRVIQYDAMVILDQDATDEEASAYNELIEGNAEIEDHLAIYQAQYEVSETGVNTQDVSLIVPLNAEQLPQFIQLRDRVSKESYSLSDQGAVVSEKLADLFSVEPGDSLTITNADNESFEVEIAHITENYTGHYLYMNEAVYHEAIGDEPLESNADLLKYDQDVAWEDQLSEQLMQEEKVVTTTFYGRVIDTFNDSMESLNVVVVVLIVAAAGLAFVVLYNLTNINVSERIRELSTIKVLGFYDGEVTMYIYRENLILTAMGIIVGGFMGRILHVFVLATAAMDNMMFAPDLHWSSYLYAAVLTFIFSSFVMWIMHRKLKGVDMIEALKSNE
ncbi:putative ABC transport system permease protein [Amphibacillus marinus]|uniref:Putative ABC transport system permease protein n=1 Tax=Amphibacillus marinus TaxID=872970 RepID=A0A1H8LG48_9BACI|nr:ABC transporter permease [Amphibacillus marinus]SEO04130.1 putative ABC transport system permease protein [Amphibacillus marinus]